MPHPSPIPITNYAELCRRIDERACVWVRHYEGRIAKWTRRHVAFIEHTQFQYVRRLLEHGDLALDMPDNTPTKEQQNVSHA